MDVALYARVSTGEQQTLPMQIGQIREYAKKRGWTNKYKLEEIGLGAKIRPQHSEILLNKFSREQF